MTQFLRQFLFLPAFICLCHAAALAGPRIKLDTNYVRSFPGRMTLRTYLGEKFSTYTLIDQASGRRLTFHPNNILGLGLGATILGIGLNFSARLPLHDPKIDRYGKTSRYDLQVHRYGKTLMLDFYFQRYRGFHLADKNEVTAITNPHEYPYFSNMEGRSIGFSALHVFNGERYSLRALVNQQEWQIRSAGSALLGGSIFTHRFSDDDSSVIPRYYAYTDFMGGNRPMAVNYYGLTVNGGYGYTWVLPPGGHFFLAAATDVGMGGGQSSVTDTQDTRLTKIGLCLTANARVGGGYNSAKWFAGIYGIYHGDLYSLPYAESRMLRNQGIIRFVVARRIPTKSRFLAKQPKRVQPEPVRPAQP
jgi:hypothetical protein